MVSRHRYFFWRAILGFCDRSRLVPDRVHGAVLRRTYAAWLALSHPGRGGAA